MRQESCTGPIAHGEASTDLVQDCNVADFRGAERRRVRSGRTRLAEHRVCFARSRPQSVPTSPATSSCARGAPSPYSCLRWRAGGSDAAWGWVAHEHGTEARA
jgi:hypothetical protein